MKMPSDHRSEPSGRPLAELIARTIRDLDGNDTIDGGINDDCVRGGLGNDRLIGEDGNDTACFPSASGVDGRAQKSFVGRE